MSPIAAYFLLALILLGLSAVLIALREGLREIYDDFPEEKTYKYQPEDFPEEK